MENLEKTSKTIQLNLCSPIPSSKTTKKIETEKERSKRVITNTDHWKFSQEDLGYQNQCKMLNDITQYPVVLQQLRNKLYGYRTQDIDKRIFEITEFIDLSGVLQKLENCKMNCFYCREPVKLLYEYVREPKQWTLDRMDNKKGHNTDNVEIACLSCNLRRKTMHHERYLFTKQMVLIKKEG